MSTAKNVVIVALLLGTAYLAYVNRKQLLRILRPQQEKKPKRRETGNAMTEVCQAFLIYADNFQGLLETMFKASVGAISEERTRNVLREWDIRMKNIAQTPIGLKSWWSTVIIDCETLTDKELQGRARQIIQMILSCGIVRDEQTEIVAQEDTCLFYENSDGSKLVTGQKLSIESPCWYLPGNPARIIEKGYCEMI